MSENASFSYFNLGIFKAFCDIHLQYQILNTIPVSASKIYIEAYFLIFSMGITKSSQHLCYENVVSDKISITVSLMDE